MESGQAPPLAGTETPLKFEYATLVVTESQRLSLPSEYQFLHAATLELFLENGCPPDIEVSAGKRLSVMTQRSLMISCFGDLTIPRRS